MLDIKLLRADPDAVAARLNVKGFELDVALFERLEAIVGVFRSKLNNCKTSVT